MTPGGEAESSSSSEQVECQSVVWNDEEKGEVKQNFTHITEMEEEKGLK